VAPVKGDTFQDDVPTQPDGTAIPADDQVEIIGDIDQVVKVADAPDDKTPAVGRRCTRSGHRLIIIRNDCPQPTKEEALAFEQCTATIALPEEGGWQVCAAQRYLRGLHDVYFGPDRRASLPSPSFSGPERRRVHQVPEPYPQE
jgi:hypothetical protein